MLRLPRFGAPRNQTLHQILTAPDRPRAIFCWSDLDAIPLLAEAFRLGLRVPQDLAIVGYDNCETAALPMVNLASMDQDGPRLGRLAATSLFSRIGGRRTAEHVNIDPELVVRGSL